MVALIAGVLYAAMIDAIDRGDERGCLFDVELRVGLLGIARGPVVFGRPVVVRYERGRR